MEKLENLRFLGFFLGWYARLHLTHSHRQGPDRLRASIVTHTSYLTGWEPAKHFNVAVALKEAVRVR